jgi:hypothetical protein
MGVFMWGLPPSGLPTISPSRGEIDSLKRAGLNHGTRHRVLLISLLVGEMSGRTEGGNSSRKGRSF